MCLKIRCFGSDFDGLPRIQETLKFYVKKEANPFGDFL